MSFWRSVVSFLAILVASVSTAQRARAEAIKIGSTKVASAGLTAALYSLGGQGALRENPLPSGRYRPNMDQSP